MTIRALTKAFDGTIAENRIRKAVARPLARICSKLKSAPDDKSISNSIQNYLYRVAELSKTMRLDLSRYVSTFPIKGANFLSTKHQADMLTGDQLIVLCTFPSIIKQARYLAASSSSDVTIIRARVCLRSKYPDIYNELPTYVHT